MQVEMKLAEMRVEQFGEMLSSDAPAPGGGSAAALEAAMGAGLVALVQSSSPFWMAAERAARSSSVALGMGKARLTCKKASVSWSITSSRARRRSSTR